MSDFIHVGNDESTETLVNLDVVNSVVYNKDTGRVTFSLGNSHIVASNVEPVAWKDFLQLIKVTTSKKG